MSTIATHQVKELLIKTFHLEMSVSEISDDMKIIGEGLELDSVDVLEIITQVDRQFKIKIKNADIKKNSFSSVAELTQFLNTYQQPIVQPSPQL
jgi:acyl carrier protein